MKATLYTLMGFIIGSVLTLYISSYLMSGRMIEISESKYNLEETVTMLESNAVAAGWKVPKIYDIQKSLAADNHKIAGLKVISLCQPKHAYTILSDDERKNISAMMPCRLSVFETSDGRVWVGRMNTTLMSRMFGGVVAEVMNEVGSETDKIIAPVMQ